MIVATQLRSRLESDGGDTFSNVLISDFIYGKEDGSEIAPALDEMREYEELKGWTSKQWTDLIQRFVPLSLVHHHPQHSTSPPLFCAHVFIVSF